MRRCDIDTGGVLWLYRPSHHKNSYRGKSRTIVLGPKAQELVRGFFTPILADYLFNPVKAIEEKQVELAAKRKSKRPPSQVARGVARREKGLGRFFREKYSRSSYGLAVDRACDRAFPLPATLSQKKGTRLPGSGGNG